VYLRLQLYVYEEANMKALIVTGGDNPPSSVIRHLSENSDIVIAADAGLEICIKAGIEPHIAIGDFDSVDPAILSQLSTEKIFRFPEEKDYSDTELAIDAAHRYGAKDIILAGGGAGRLDHLLAIRALFERNDPIKEWHTAHESAFLVDRGFKLQASMPINSVVSVFPLSEGALGMRSNGLKWPLDGLKWDCSEFGLSNKTISEEIEIYSGEKPILVILPLDLKISISQDC